VPIKVGLQVIKIWNDSLESKVRYYESIPKPEGQIVFYGPSNFTRWDPMYGETSMEEVLLGKSGAQCVVNRGFGSSCAEHQLYYYPRMIRPLAPSVLVYDCTGNNTAFGYTVEETWELAQRVIAYAQADFPDIRIYLCSSHPSLNDTPESLQYKRTLDLLIQQYTETHDNCFYIDGIHYAPLSRKDIFIADGVHYNHAGYRLYTKFFREKLAKELERF